MNKISISDTIRSAYAFAFGQIGTIIGLVWLPCVILAILQFLPYAIGTAKVSSDANPGTAGAAVLLNLAFFVTGAVLSAMNCVSVTRQALGLREGPASVHFSLGLPECRMFGAIVLCGLVLMTIGGLFAGALAVLAAFIATIPFMGLVVMLAAVAGIAGFIYIVVRLTFLLAPVVVAEDKIDLARAWTLTDRNFWSIFAVMIAVVVPFVIVQVIALAVIAGPAFFAPLPAHTANIADTIADRIQTLDRHMPMIIGLGLLLTPFSLGLNLGAEAAAYRALVPSKGQIRAN